MEDKEQQNDLVEFIANTSRDIADEYVRIRKRVSEDPGTAGDQGEENWAELLRGWLPHTFHIVTKGRILSHDGTTSPQVDVIVLRPEYPPHLLAKKLYLAGGVLAAFECKLTLKAAHIKKFMQNSIAVKACVKNEKGTPYKELHSNILYGLLSHSYDWKNSKNPVEVIYNNIVKYDDEFITHPSQLPDIICVADLATWSVTKVTFFGPNQMENWDTMSHLYGEHGSATSGYLSHDAEQESQSPNFSPVGAMISSLYRKLAWNVPSLRTLANYFSASRIEGTGKGNMRIWPSCIYSDKIRHRVEMGRLTNGEAWNEWSIGFY